MPRRSVIGVVGTGREAEPAVSHARELGRLIAKRGWVMITGGRNAGVMNAASDGAKEVGGGLAIAILPSAEIEVSRAADVAVVTGMGEARNNVIVLSADVVIACGVDDAGTASEVSLALKAGKPVILVTGGDAAERFFSGIGGEKIHIAGTPADAVAIATRLV